MVNPELSRWFGLSYASFLTLPRVLMEDMPDEWQAKMAELLNEYDAAYSNQPDLEPFVQFRRGNRFVKAPEWILNYRRPNKEEINKLKPNNT